jgi:predicted ATP-dependent Lon-type protease
MPGWETPKASKDILTVHCGFVTDYIAEAFRVLRKDNRFDEVERHYRFGSHVEGRDATATKKTVSAFLKLIHPDGEYTLEELQTYLELALEGRRRVKEQLKKRWSFEFYKTSFSYIGKDDGTERTVAVPEQGGKGAISQDPLPPGSLYTVATDAEGKVGLFRLEASLTAGTGKIRAPAGLEKGLKESLNRAVSYLQLVKEKLGLTLALAQKDSRLRALLAKPSTEKTSKVPEQAGIQTPPKNIPPPNAPGPPKPGHGRHSAQAYGGARRIRIVHASQAGGPLSGVPEGQGLRTEGTCSAHPGGGLGADCGHGL